MEFLTIFLSSLLAAVSPTGLVLDTVVENQISSRLAEVEQLEVRIDNAPSYQILQGKVEKVRFAGRGLYVTPELRINALELETDPISLDIQGIRQGNLSQLRQSLRQPLQGGLRLELSQADLNQALQSPAIKARMQAVIVRLLSSFTGSSSEDYELINPRIDFLGNNKFRLQMELRRNNPDDSGNSQLNLSVESQLSVSQGYKIELVEPTVTLNDNPIPSFLLQGFTAGLNNRLNLQELEQAGILARVLQLEIDEEVMNLAAFVRLEPLLANSLP